MLVDNHNEVLAWDDGKLFSAVTDSKDNMSEPASLRVLPSLDYEDFFVGESRRVEGTQAL